MLSLPVLRLIAMRVQPRVDTLQDPREPLQEPFSFLFGSCLMSRSPPFDRVVCNAPCSPCIAHHRLQGLLDELPALSPHPGQGCHHLRWVFADCVAAFALLIGDSIYTDVVYNLTPEQAYWQLIAGQSFARFTRTVPTMFQASCTLPTAALLNASSLTTTRSTTTPTTSRRRRFCRPCPGTTASSASATLRAASVADGCAVCAPKPRCCCSWEGRRFYSWWNGAIFVGVGPGHSQTAQRMWRF